MTKSEFLEKLKEALSNELNERMVMENVTYYDSYIREEMQKGRAETEVIAELGDPWVIARSVIDAADSTGGYQDGGNANVYETERKQSGSNQGYGRNTGNQVHVFGLDTWWKKLILILGIIGVILLVVAVIGGIFSLLAPILVPVLIVMLVLRLIGGNRR